MVRRSSHRVSIEGGWRLLFNVDGDKKSSGIVATVGGTWEDVAENIAEAWCVPQGCRAEGEVVLCWFGRKKSGLSLRVVFSWELCTGS